MSYPHSDCPKCTSSHTCGNEDGPEYTCRDCGHMWEGQHSAYDHEPEINPDR